MDKDIKEIAEYWADYFDNTPSMEDKSAEAEAYRLAQYILNPWIPVSERLPEENGWYLVCVMTPYGMENNAEPLICLNQWDNETWRESYVTHWMPLPQSPDKE